MVTTAISDIITITIIITTITITIMMVIIIVHYMLLQLGWSSGAAP